MPSPIVPTVIPNRLNPIQLGTNYPIAGTSTPQDYVQHFKIPDFMDKIKQGLEIGKSMINLPTEATNALVQKHYLALADEQAKVGIKYLKDVQSGKVMNPNGSPMTEEQKTDAIKAFNLRQPLMQGMQVGPQGVTTDPGMGARTLGVGPYQTLLGTTTTDNTGGGSNPQNPQKPVPQVVTPQTPQKVVPQQQQDELQRRIDEGYINPSNYQNLAYGGISPAPIAIAPQDQYALYGGNLAPAPIA